jgi:hypothetical protein
MKSDLGKPMDGIIDDYNWYLDYPEQIPSVAVTCGTSGVSYGTFCDAGCGVPWGVNNIYQWALSYKINMQSYNASLIPPAARLCVATWGPTACVTVPETTYTNLSAFCNLAMTSPYVLQAPPVALYSVWSSTCFGRYTPSYSQYMTWTGSGGGYNGSGVLGAVALSQNTNGGIQGLVPLYGYYNGSINQYGLSTSPNDSSLNGNGYTMQSTLGYVFPATTGSAAGGVPLYEYYKSVVNQYNYSNTSTVPGGFVQVGSGPAAYMLPGFLHNGYGANGPY